MLLLAIDTAGPDCSAAVARVADGGSALLASMSEPVGRGHAERLVPLIEAALAQAGVGYPDLQRIVVTTGPGSFTGVRIGISAARGLALALDIPAVGVGSLAALAYGAGKGRGSGTIAAALDARRGQVYLAAFDAASGEVVIEAAAFSPEGAVERLRRMPWPLVLAGAGAPLLAPLFEGCAPVLAGLRESTDPADIVAASLGAETAGVPKPIYARAADAKPQAGVAVAHA